ncbi:fimbrial protein StaE [Salmonella enterica subsp. enterica]|nr:fimbrial protein StaE [Salmonella enterica]EBV2386610.1 fimbrial protein [Salmonella enterica subsp. enterica serovar Mississippi]ECW0842719.1 fimbrial protein StaE [Salmonella enterica subsp. enterica]EDD9543069.1 fimbrial protein StaE [Salmonella enterica subsp. enterica serovar Rissen]EAY3692852.1 fimbrial protein StaE [Salmonella enterica]
MIMKKQILRVVIFSSLIATGAGISTMTYADGTNSLDLTVNANITAGTCSASVVEGDTITDTIAFGNVYISEVYAKSKIKPFKLRFSDCVGLKDKKAKFRLAPNNVACPGSSGTDGQFANASTSTTKAAMVAMEVWTTETPGGTGAVKLHCWSKPEQTVDLSGASVTTPVDFPLSAMMVVQSGGTLQNMTAGDFYSPTTFTITYQ